MVAGENCEVAAEPWSIWSVSLGGCGFGKGPGCHDVYFRLKSCGFLLLLHIINSVPWRWLPNQTVTTRVLKRKVQPSVYALSKLLFARTGSVVLWFSLNVDKSFVIVSIPSQIMMEKWTTTEVHAWVELRCSFEYCCTVKGIVLHLNCIIYLV